MTEILISSLRSIQRLVWWHLKIRGIFEHSIMKTSVQQHVSHSLTDQIFTIVSCRGQCMSLGKTNLDWLSNRAMVSSQKQPTHYKSLLLVESVTQDDWVRNAKESLQHKLQSLQQSLQHKRHTKTPSEILYLISQPAPQCK